MENARTEYRIIGRFAKDDKPHVVDYNCKWTKAQAENRLKELKEREERAKEKKRYTDSINGIGIETEYYSDYELLDLRIQSRQVTKWS